MAEEAEKKTNIEAQNTCAYFVERKKRKCRMNVKSGKRFCGEHCVFEEPTDEDDKSKDKTRMPCPYDPNHSCFVSRLEKHLLRCNSRPKIQPDYVKVNVNVISADSHEVKINLGSLEDQELLAFIERVRQIHKDYVGQIHDSIGHHKSLKTTLDSLQTSRGSWRHVYQNSSILHNMDEGGLIQANDEGKTYIEFGSGRGQLGYYLGQILDRETQSLVLIDKSSPRHKHENRFKVDGAWSCPVERIRANIADVDLSCIPQIQKSNCIVGTGKHLCGGATDLALQSLYNAAKNMQKAVVKGVCIALCCHHQCTWQTYVGKPFFKEVDLSQRDFAILKAMTSWATCGSRSFTDKPTVSDKTVKETPEDYPPNVEEDEDEDEHATNIDDNVPVPRYAALGLDASTREELGRQCKQIIDHGRVRFLSTEWPVSPLKSRLVHYVERHVSLENVLLLATLC